MRYEVQFYGRRIGALGVTYPITAVVDAATEDAARLQLYETYEHILTPVYREVCTNCGQYRHDGRCLNDCQTRGFDPPGGS